MKIIQSTSHSIFTNGIFLLAEYGAVLSGFLIFIQLATSLSPGEFAQWEWLHVWLGLCLLLPRNGLDIVAIRSMFRHPSHLSEWSMIVIGTRFCLSLPAFLLMITGGFFIKTDQLSTVLLALTLPVSAGTPDLAARVQGRFKKYSLILSLKSLCILTFLSCWKPVSFQSIAAFYFICDCSICLLWWIDAWQYGSLPGGQWLKLLRRGGRAILARSMNQSLARWVRVLSYSSDALLLGLLAPGTWALIAPGRRLLISCVMPFGNWVGSTGHQMTHWNLAKSKRVDTILKYICILFTLFILTFAFCLPSIIILNTNSRILLTVLARAGYLAYSFWLMALQSAFRQDRNAWMIPGFLTGSGIFISLPASVLIEIPIAILIMMPIEWCILILARNQIFRQSTMVKVMKPANQSSTARKPLRKQRKPIVWPT